jgi:uncharacterized OsmC-like protein
MTTQTTRINGIDTDKLSHIAASATSPEAGAASFAADTTWDGGFQSTSQFTQWTFGGHAIPRNATLTLNTPKQMGGSDTSPTPLEAYLAALNACLVVGLVLQCSARGIEIRSLQVRSNGAVDARSFLSADPSIKPGYPKVTCAFMIDADTDDDTLREVFDLVLSTSPNHENVTGPVPLEIDYQLASAHDQLEQH